MLKCVLWMFCRGFYLLVVYCFCFVFGCLVGWLFSQVFHTKELKSKAAARVECIFDYRCQKIEENTPACTVIKKTNELDQK